MTYRAGELDQRITFQERVSVSDGIGGSVDTWQNIAELSEVWAHARSKSGREMTEFDRINAERGYLFVLRNRQDIDPSYRILWDGEPFNIKTIKKPKTRALYLEIEAESGVPQ